MISFAEFILRYCDDWNIWPIYLADDLNISSVTLMGWVYRGMIPKDKYDIVLEEYFGEDLKNVKFDGKKFRRKIKVTRSDGSCQIYDTKTDVSKAEGMSLDTITRCLKSGEAMRRGNYKGYRFEKVYIEVD